MSSVRVLYWTRLANSGRYSIVFKLLRSGDTDNGFVTAKFVCTDRRGHVKAFSRNVGDVLGDRYSAEVADYTGSGRKQVFLTAGVRATHTCILDCDGTRLRTLFEGCCLYVPNLVCAGPNRWYVEEFARRDSTGLCSGTWYETDDDWRYYPYSASEEKMQTHGGPGVIVVARLLAWNGSVFSPLEPGKSRVVVMPYRRYLKSHGIPVPRRYSRPTLKNPDPDFYNFEAESKPPTIAGMNIVIQ